METTQKYKLYKVTVEKQIVVAAYAELSRAEVELSIPNLSVIHDTSLMQEPNSFVLAEEIKDPGDLPEGWTVGALPYFNSNSASMPFDIINKTIQQFLSDNNDSK